MGRLSAGGASKVRKTLRTEESLEGPAENAGETYERILVKIDELYREDVWKVLQFLAFSACPVSLEEVVEVLAVFLEDSPRFDPEQRYPEPREILTGCSSLVSISFLGTIQSKNQLRLARFSVKEYLVSIVKLLLDNGACTSEFEEFFSPVSATKGGYEDIDQ